MKNWTIEYLNEAVDDMELLKNSQHLHVLKAIEKVSINPLPKSSGGYGKPLGNKGNLKLSGYFKIKLKKLGLRVVYKIISTPNIMKIIVISARAEDEVYISAYKRIMKD